MLTIEGRAVYGVTIEDNTPTFRNAKDAAVTKALEMIGMQADNYARMECPVDTGRLRASINHAQQGKDTEVIGTNVEYAAYVEFGTSKMAAQPYLKPAAMDHSAEYRAIAESCLRGA